MLTLRKTAAVAAAFLTIQGAAIAQQSPPVPQNDVIVVPAKSAFFACDFDLRIQLVGKGGFLTLPGGRFLSITTSPGLKATLTNLANNHAATVDVSGTNRHSLDPYGNNVYNVAGRNLLGDPTTGLVVAVGDFSFVFDSSGTTLVKPLSGHGRLIDACLLVQ